MAINADGLIQASRGTLFTAPAKTALPTKVSSFLLNSGTVAAAGSGSVVNWENIGHTSNNNKISFSKDGGDTTTKDTWLVAGAKSSTEAPTITVSGASVQGDSATITKVTGGWAGDQGGIVVPLQPVVQHLALFVLAYDDSDKLSFGLYLPETDFTFDNVSLADEDFAEFSFNAVVKSTSVLKAGANGEVGAYQIFAPETFVSKTSPDSSGKNPGNSSQTVSGLTSKG